MSTARATTHLIKSKERIKAKIQSIKSKAEKKIMECEDELKQIDKAIEVLSSDSVTNVRKLAV